MLGTLDGMYLSKVARKTAKGESLCVNSRFFTVLYEHGGVKSQPRPYPVSNSQHT